MILEPVITFTLVENSIDAASAVFFALAAYYATTYLIKNQINIQGKVVYVFIIVLSLMHIHQTLFQALFGASQYTFRVWDIINILTAVMFYISSERIHRREKYETTMS